MNRAIKSAIAATLARLDYAVLNRGHYQQLSMLEDDLDTLLKLPRSHIIQLLDMASKSKSQIRQDLYVLSELDFKRNGFFVDFGATNGIDLNNSYLLEKDFDWTGIVAEPAQCWHADLKRNRKCKIETDCVWTESNCTLTFNETDAAELSTINVYSSTDSHSPRRNIGKTYDVSTISLVDLLKKYSAPRQIDYLSIDTEGSEFEILNSFDFSQYEFRVITCEHNFTANRSKIVELLASKGYEQKYVGLSKFDAWFVKRDR